MSGWELLSWVDLKVNLQIFSLRVEAGGGHLEAVVTIGIVIVGVNASSHRLVRVLDDVGLVPTASVLQRKCAMKLSNVTS